MRPPAAKAWTLRLKHGRRTVLLFADPSAPLLHLKESLLDALRAPPARAHGADDHRNGAAPPPFPSRAADIELARPVDASDITAGFEMVGAAWSAAGSADAAADGEAEGAARDKDSEDDGGEVLKMEEEGAGRAARAGASGQRSGAEPATEDGRSLTSLGIKENAVLAYRFRGGEAEKRLNGEDPGWSIEVPSFEDAYGVENDGDLGVVRSEFQG
jgi:hypothetical protein